MAMRVGLQVGFGALIGAELLQELRGFGLDMIRISANRPGPEFAATESATAMAQEVLDAGLQPLIIIRDPAQIEQIPAGVDIEVGNEPDMSLNGWREGNGNNPSMPSYVDMAMRAIDTAGDRNPLWLGCPRGLHAQGFSLLKQLPWGRIPATVGCSFHRYPDGKRGPQASSNKTGGRWGGFFGKEWTRDQEVAELRRIVGARPLGLSEVGYNGLEYPEADAAKHLAWERNFWEGHGLSFAIAYNINSGPSASRNVDDHYGFRRPDLSWKPCKDAWCGPRGSRASM